VIETSHISNYETVCTCGKHVSATETMTQGYNVMYPNTKATGRNQDACVQAVKQDGNVGLYMVVSD